MLRHLSHFNRLFKQTRSRSISAIALLRNQTVDSTATCYSKIDCPTGAPSFDHLIANILSAVDEDGYDNFQLNQVRSNVTKWLVEAPVWDREELITKLQSIMADKGRFACVLGGTSVGKSFVVRKLSKDKTKNILYVNMRFESDLQKAILIAMAYSPNHSIVAEAIKSIMDNPDCIGKESRTEAVSSTGKIDHALGNMLARAFANPNIADSAANTLGRLLVENMSAESVDKSLVDMARSLGNLTVIVDAANIAFDSEYSVDLKTSRSAQALLSAMTKENTMLNVILVSGEHAFPFLLKDKMPFKLADFNEFIFVGEIPPSKMLELLTKEWGLGPNLSLALVDTFGGHIHHVSSAIYELANAEPTMPFDCRRVCHAEPMDLNLCFEWAERNNHVDQLHKTLIALTRDGFCPVNGQDDPVARVLSKHNIAGLVPRSGWVLGLDDAVWAGHNYLFGLVPTSQAMRLIIADALRTYNK